MLKLVILFLFCCTVFIVALSATVIKDAIIVIFCTGPSFENVTPTELRNWLFDLNDLQTCKLRPYMDYISTTNLVVGVLCPVHTADRRRRDSTVELSSVGGVY